MKAELNPNKEQYLATVNELETLRKKLPHVEHDFMLDVASMPIEELRRRVLVQFDWLGHFHHALDGIKEIRYIPGGGMDGFRAPDEVRRVVEELVKNCQITWESDFRGKPKAKLKKKKVKL